MSDGIHGEGTERVFYKHSKDNRIKVFYSHREAYIEPTPKERRNNTPLQPHQMGFSLLGEHMLSMLELFWFIRTKKRGGTCRVKHRGMDGKISIYGDGDIYTLTGEVHSASTKPAIKG